MNIIYKSILLAAIFFVMGCTADKEASPVTESSEQESTIISISKNQFEASGMANGQLEKKRFVKAISVNGKINLPNKSKAIVSSIMSGTIGSINLLEGQWIKKGQPLFTVTNPELIDLQEQYFVLKSKIEYLREEQKRKQQLVNEKLSPKQELLLAQSEYQINQAKFKTVGQKLKMYGVKADNLSIDQMSSSLTIYSPISGYVSGINALRGQYIDPSTEVIVIDNKSNIYLALNVLEQDASLISNGQDISFTVTGSSEVYNAIIHLISPSVNDNGMVTVHCKIIDAKKLIPGMYATADMILESNEANALPEDAIVQIEGKNYILVQSTKSNEESRYIPTAVELGSINDGYIEIVNESSFENKTLLIKGGYYVVK